MGSKPISLPRHSKGKRPQFFNDEGMEHLLAMILELSTELAVAYNRIDRLERVLVAAGVTSQEALDAYEPGEEALKAQDAWSDLLLDRLYSSVEQASTAG
ncbi:hypothetical protein [Sphingomonas hengshuiensis]|uniref:Uncharacterized protein n=1 Tax=Sphingomonas hengshuiensis TaxID=1609977 RepID=A0A7U5BF29_9SPHN|nr:hypothetical protein [Sphingomonas hengshuiensis]AJP74075.1 hypothetical protein TS85_23180 [Sphingomonas hengshuiensis]